MTRKDYQMIAEAIRDAGLSASIRPTKQEAVSAEAAIYRAADYIADGLLSDNPAFDRKRFMAACGLE